MFHVKRLCIATIVFFLTACAYALDPVGSLPADIRKPPSNFLECVQEGGKILKSYPAQCVSQTGEHFVEGSTNAQGSSCKDMCGDGTCQEIVCMALGCPCAETHTSCAKDCKDAP